MKLVHATTKKSLIKKLTWKLESSFITLEEFSNYSTRKSRKVIKIIAKLEDVKLTRSEVKEIALFIKTLKQLTDKKIIKKLSKQNNVVTKLFSDIPSISKSSEGNKFERVISFIFTYIFTFRKQLEKVLLI